MLDFVMTIILLIVNAVCTYVYYQRKSYARAILHSFASGVLATTAYILYLFF